MEHDGSKVIHINFSPSHVDGIYFPALDVVGDIAHPINALTRHIHVQDTWDFSYDERVKKEIDINLPQGEDDDRFPIIPQRIVHDVRKVMPADGILSLDNGIYKIWFSRNYHAHLPNTLLLDNALASMGAGMAAAMAAKMVYPDRKVMALCGDGGFMMNSQDLETAIRLKLDLVIVILRDDAYGMIKWKQAAMNFPDYSLNFSNPDFVAYANSYGASGHRVSKAEDLVPQLTECLNKPGVHVIDVPVDYSENERVLNKELQEKTCLL